jgi:hypothetical protein
LEKFLINPVSFKNLIGGLVFSKDLKGKTPMEVVLASAAYAPTDKMNFINYFYEISTNDCDSKEIEEKVLVLLKSYAGDSDTSLTELIPLISSKFVHLSQDYINEELSKEGNKLERKDQDNETADANEEANENEVIDTDTENEIQEDE